MKKRNWGNHHFCLDKRGAVHVPLGKDIPYSIGAVILALTESLQ